MHFPSSKYLLLCLIACSVPLVAACKDSLPASFSAKHSPHITLDRSAVLLGVDANHDGIRDDIERYIAALPETPAQKLALRQVAKAINVAMALGNELDSRADGRLRSATQTIARAVGCLWQRYDGGAAANNHLTLVRKITTNTSARNAAYLRYNSFVGSYALSGMAGDRCDQ